MGRNSLQNKPHIRFRVQDKNGKITSHAALGAAVGWAKQKVSAFHRALLRANPERSRLPHRRYNFAWPKKQIIRIEIESIPWRGHWEVRIIGGSEIGGSFLMWPTQGGDGPPTNGLLRDLIIVNSLDRDGPYDVVVIPTIPGTFRTPPVRPEAGLIDWKGPLRTENSAGAPLDPPQRDVLTWDGPDNRYGPQHWRRRFGTRENLRGIYVGGPFIYKDGRKFARVPDIQDPEGDDTPEVPFRLSTFRGRVCSAALQRYTNVEGDERTHLIAITDELTVGIGTGPDGLGDGKFHVWFKPDSTFADLRNDIFDPTFPSGFGTGPGGRNNFRGGWQLLAEITPPRGFYPERWIRSRMWFPNQSGTEMSTMLPVQEQRDDGTYPVIIRNNTAWLSVSDPRITGVRWSTFPWTLQEATIKVEFTGVGDAGTATLELGPLNNNKITATETAGGLDVTVSGTINTEFSDDNGDCTPDSTDGDGIQEENITYERDITYGGGPWNVAIDYKGDSKVYAKIDVSDDAEFCERHDTVKTTEFGPPPGGFVLVPVSRTHDVTYDKKDIRGTKLVVGATEIEIGRREHAVSGQAVTTVNDDGTGSASGSEAHTNNSGETPENVIWVPSEGAAVLWMDLREDLVVWSVAEYQQQINATRSIRDGGGSSTGVTGIPGQWSPLQGTAEHGTLIQVWRAGNLVNEYRQTVDCDARSRIGTAAPVSSWRVLYDQTSTTIPDFCVPGDDFDPPGTPLSWATTSTAVDVQFPNGDLAGGTSFSSDRPVFESEQAETPSLEILAGPDTLRIQDWNEFLLEYEHPSRFAIDGARNLAYSITTPAVRSQQDGRFDYRVVSSCFLTIPPDPQYLNYIDGDNLIDVMNQVTYIGNGPDRVRGTADDITLVPLEEGSPKHARSIIVRVLG